MSAKQDCHDLAEALALILDAFDRTGLYGIVESEWGKEQSAAMAKAAALAHGMLAAVKPEHVVPVRHVAFLDSVTRA